MVKLTDFGLIGTVTVPEDTRLFCGTPLYISPEVSRRQNSDTKADIWSFGVILFELIFRKTPFQVPKGASSMNYNTKLTFPPTVILDKDIKSVI